jgi:Domain of unknown function (DUF4136)
MKMTRTKWIRWTVALLFAASVTLFAQLKVDWDRNVSFANFKTYNWGKGTPLQNSIWDQRVVDGIDRQLAAKGLQKVDEKSSPDLIVVYHAAIGTTVEVSTMGTGGWGWRWGGGMTTTSVDKIPVGQLSVDIGDATTKKLVWLASASDTLSDNPDKNQKKLKSTLEKMFTKFPPPPTK